MKNFNVSHTQFNYSETYLVKFWYTNEGYITQSEMEFFSEGKAAHKLVEQYAKKYLLKRFNNVKIITINYI